MSSIPSFKGEVVEIVNGSSLSKPHIITLSDRIVITYSDASGVYASVKVEERDLTTRSLIHSYSVGFNDCNVKGGTLLKGSVI